VIHGPANADNFRVKQGRFGDRWYTDPLPACDIADTSEWRGPSVSATKPPFANKYVPMKAIASMDGDTLHRLADQSTDDRYEAFKAHDKRTGRINMGRGTIVHAWAEDLLAGRPMVDPIGDDPETVEQANQFRGPLQAFFDAHQPEPVAVEVVCLHRSLNSVGYGGTADVFARVDGGIWAIDWKSRTSDHGAYLEEAAQGGAYCGAEYMIVDAGDGTAKRAPIPDVAGVLIVSITRDGFKVFPIDRDGAVDAYQEMHRWWVAQRRVIDDKVIGRPWAPKIAAGGSDSSRDNGTATTEPLAASNRDRLRERIRGLINHGHEELVRAAWPQGVPPLSKDGHTTEQLEAILSALHRAEAAIGAQFHDDDMAAAKPEPKPKPEPPTPAPTIDEGGNAAQGVIDELQRRLGELSRERRQMLSEIAADANTAGRSISVSKRPSERRVALVGALVDWAASEASYDDLWAAAALTATDEQTVDADQRLGALISQFTTRQAAALADTFTATAAA